MDNEVYGPWKATKEEVMAMYRIEMSDKDMNKSDHATTIGLEIIEEIDCHESAFRMCLYKHKEPACYTQRCDVERDIQSK